MEIQNIHDICYLLTAISAGIILTLSFLLVSIHLPKGIVCRKFNKARFYLALSYFILGLSGLFSCTLPENSTHAIEILLITVCVASFQSLLFTSTYIIFIQPNELKKENVVKHLMGITFYMISLAFIYQRSLLNETELIYVTIIPYIAQQIYYTYKFHRCHKICVKQIGRNYDAEQESRLKRVTYSFYAALSIGLFSIVSSLSGLWMYVVFIILYTLFYTYMVVLVYNNAQINEVIHPAVTHTEPQVHSKSETAETSQQSATASDNEEAHTHETVQDMPAPIPAGVDEEEYNKEFQEKLKNWIANKGYTQKDLSVDDMANMLGINRDYLRYYFRTYIHSDFRTWRSELRIKESKNVMREHPDYTFSKIAEIVGFNHRANFFNQFVKIEGMTPTEWRDQQDFETNK